LTCKKQHIQNEDVVGIIKTDEGGVKQIQIKVIGGNRGY
jgi:hypothetical protein